MGASVSMSVSYLQISYCWNQFRFEHVPFISDWKTQPKLTSRNERNHIVYLHVLTTSSVVDTRFSMYTLCHSRYSTHSHHSHIHHFCILHKINYWRNDFRFCNTVTLQWLEKNTFIRMCAAAHSYSSDSYSHSYRDVDLVNFEISYSIRT